MFQIIILLLSYQPMYCNNVLHNIYPITYNTNYKTNNESKEKKAQ